MWRKTMGYRLHFHARHDIRYGGFAAFNHMQEEVYALLVDHGCAVSADNVDDPCFAESFSVPKEDIEGLVEELEGLPPGEVALRGEFGDGIEASYTAAEVAGFFRDVLRDADPDNESVYFEWY